MVKKILFDLDGTLLPMDQDKFTEIYLKNVAKYAIRFGFEPAKTAAGMWKGVEAMVKNDGKCSNYDAFWQAFSAVVGTDASKYAGQFDEFYRGKGFSAAKAACGFKSDAGKAVHALKTAGYDLILASNPVFPKIAHLMRLTWAGVDKNDFSLVTSYENMRYCKPNPDYYRQILSMLNVNAEECLMVGNDVDEDMVAERLGMKVFLITDGLLNRSGKDFSCFPQGGFSDLSKYVETL